MRYETLIAGVWLLSTAAILPVHVSGQAAPDPLTPIRIKVANEFVTDLALYTSAWPAAVDPRHVEVTEVIRCGRLALFRAKVASHFHSSPYSVLVTDTLVTLVGPGYSDRFARAAELARASDAVGTDSALAEVLVRAIEARHGTPMILQETLHPDTSSSALARWRSVTPPQWPTSGVRVMDDGRRLVRLTALRPAAHSADQQYTPIAYAFMFAPNGALLSIAVRDGAPF